MFIRFNSSLRTTSINLKTTRKIFLGVSKITNTIVYIFPELAYMKVKTLLKITALSIASIHRNRTTLWKFGIVIVRFFLGT